MFQRVVKRYSSNHVDPRYAQHWPPAIRLEVVYTLMMRAIPVVEVHAGTKPNGYPEARNCELTVIEDAEFPHWRAAKEKAEDGIPVSILIPSATPRNTSKPGWLASIVSQRFNPKPKPRVVSLEQNFGVAIGEFLVDALIRAVYSGVFAALPRTKDCQVFVMSYDNYYVWPEKRDRGKINVIGSRVFAGSTLDPPLTGGPKMLPARGCSARLRRGDLLCSQSANSRKSPV